MSFIHDATGSVGSFAGYVIAATGVAVYYFRYVRKYVKADRKLLVKVHRYTALLMAGTILIHIFTTNKGNLFVYGSLLFFVSAAVMGMMLRISRIKTGYFKKIILAKAAVVIIAALFVTVGHSYFEKEREQQSLAATGTSPYSNSIQCFLSAGAPVSRLIGFSCSSRENAGSDRHITIQ